MAFKATNHARYSLSPCQVIPNDPHCDASCKTDSDVNVCSLNHEFSPEIFDPRKKITREYSYAYDKEYP